MTAAKKFDPVATISAELGLATPSVQAVVALLSEGNTVPFVARYRKEATGGMDEVQIRAIEERHAYLLEFEKRREAIVASIVEQGKMTDDLLAKLNACTTKAQLEDLYLPYKPKRRTRATIAREKGLEPLAMRILAQPLDGDPGAEAQAFLSDEAEKEVPDVEAALAGARDIVAEVVAEDAEVRALVRARFAADGVLVSQVVEAQKEQGAKFQDYFAYEEAVAKMPSHRFLAVRRGEREGVLRTTVSVSPEPMVARLLQQVQVQDASPFAEQLRRAVEDCYRRLLAPSMESDIRIELKMNADKDAVDVFAANLRALLLAAPLGSQAVIGVDPGMRTGCKCAAVDRHGNFLGHMTFNLVQGAKAEAAAREQFVRFCQQHQPLAVAVGNGTYGRETERFVRQTLKEAGRNDIIAVSVSESGASVYSASPLAGKEFPDLDLTIRGAISIARRLQDPLAELVKIDPKSIGVGQYQHDVHQPLLGKKLEEVVESCVNGVGVELNTASVALLSHVAGIGAKTAENIVAHRRDIGGFRNRKQLLKVKGLGPRAFEQSAGFLRIREGDNPLDASAVHPERYEVVTQMAGDLGVSLAELVGNASLAERIELSRYMAQGIGAPTLRDIVDELKKPGRDPREQFEPPAFRDDVNSIEDLQVGMRLEGVVTNVTHFGAFVDVGVHRDGLVHISELCDRFVRDPAEVVKVGDKINVCVIELDVPRGRISFSARSQPGASRRDDGPQSSQADAPPQRGTPRPPPRWQDRRQDR